jgi:hypothetical protein
LAGQLSASLISGSRAVRGPQPRGPHVIHSSHSISRAAPHLHPYLPAFGLLTCGTRSRMDPHVSDPTAEEIAAKDLIPPPSTSTRSRRFPSPAVESRNPSPASPPAVVAASAVSTGTQPAVPLLVRSLPVCRRPLDRSIVRRLGSRRIGIGRRHVQGQGLHRRQRAAPQGVLGLRGAHRSMGVSDLFPTPPFHSIGSSRALLARPPLAEPLAILPLPFGLRHYGIGPTNHRHRCCHEGWHNNIQPKLSVAK